MNTCRKKFPPWLGWFTLTEFRAKGSGAPRLTRESVATTAKLWGEGVIGCHAAWPHGFGKSGFSWIFYKFLVFSVIIVRLEDLYIYRLLALHNLIIFTFRECLKRGQSRLRKTTVSTVFWFCGWFLHRISLLKVMVRSELIWVDWITVGAHGYHTRLGLKVWNGWDDKMGGWDEGLLLYFWMTMCLWSHVFKKAMTNRSPAQKRTIEWTVWNKVIYEFRKKKTVPTKAHYLAGFFFTDLDPDIKIAARP